MVADRYAAAVGSLLEHGFLRRSRASRRRGRTLTDALVDRGPVLARGIEVL
jgi:hypothetical protein